MVIIINKIKLQNKQLNQIECYLQLLTVYAIVHHVSGISYYLSATANPILYQVGVWIKLKINTQQCVQNNELVNPWWLIEEYPIYRFYHWSFDRQCVTRSRVAVLSVAAACSPVDRKNRHSLPVFTTATSKEVLSHEAPQREVQRWVATTTVGTVEAATLPPIILCWVRITGSIDNILLFNKRNKMVTGVADFFCLTIYMYIFMNGYE